MMIIIYESRAPLMVRMKFREKWKKFHPERRNNEEVVTIHSFTYSFMPLIIT